MLTVLGAFLIMRGVDTAVPMSIYALNLIVGLGLGLAIDYSLFVVSRFREELERAGDVRARCADARHRRPDRVVLVLDRRRGAASLSSSRSGSCTRWGSAARPWR